MKRVLHIVSSMGYGGIQSFLMNVYKEVDKSEIQFDFLTFSENNAFEKDILELGGKLFTISPRNEGFFKQKKELRNFFKNNHYDIVHYHVSSLTNIMPIKIAKKYKVKKRIIHSHNTYQQGNKIHKYLHNINKIGIHNAATDYYACSESASLWLYENTRIPKEKREVVYNGINLEKFKFDIIKRDKLKKDLNLENKFIIGHVARLTDQKNQFFLLDIFKKISSIKQDAKLLIIGEGKLESALKEYAEKLSILDDIIFLGAISDVYKYYSIMDIFLLPSNHEGLPVTLIEAQANALPCIVSEEAVTLESCVSNEFYRLSILKSENEWSRKCMEVEINTLDRQNKEINMDKFDIKVISELLSKKYIEM